MEKYGILHEYICSCGYHVIARDSGEINEIVKEASVGMFGIPHMHEFKEVFDDGREESSNLRPEQYAGEK